MLFATTPHNSIFHFHKSRNYSIQSKLDIKQKHSHTATRASSRLKPAYFFPSGQMQGNCKIWGAHPNAPLFAYQWWGWCPCLLKPNWLWNVCSLLNDILTAYDETIVAQQSDREWLCFILSAGGPSGPGQQQHHWALYQTRHIMASFNERRPACSCSASTPLEYRTIFWCKWLSTKSFY